VCLQVLILLLKEAANPEAVVSIAAPGGEDAREGLFNGGDVKDEPTGAFPGISPSCTLA